MSTADSVRGQLAAIGAPLWDKPPCAESMWPLAETLAAACQLSHEDASVAKVLPYTFFRVRSELSFERLQGALFEAGEAHTAGFFLAIAVELWGDPTLRYWSEKLRDMRLTTLQDFFPSSSRGRLRELAERNTPDLARQWHFRINMSLEDFGTVMRKFPLDEST